MKNTSNKFNSNKSNAISFNSYTQLIMMYLRERMGEDCTMFSHTVRKNNGVELTGIVMKRKGHNISPTIYIDEHYHPDITIQEIEEIVEAIYQRIQEAALDEDLDLTGFVDFEKAKGKLVFKLISEKKNRQLLLQVPHKRFLDLAMVFYYPVQESPFNGKAAILVYNSHLKLWDIDEDELAEIAIENTPKLFPSEIESMEDMMKDILEKGFPEPMMQNTSAHVPMYVLTNRQKLNGAACMLYPNIIKEFAEKKGQDFYILPSSVHEVLLVPTESNTNKDSLLEIVTDINRTQVAEEEVLADAVYYYSRSKNKIILISEKILN